MSAQDVYYERGENANDELTEHATGAGEWSSSADSSSLAPAALPPEQFDYSAGMFAVVPGTEVDALPGSVHPLIAAKLATEEPARAYQTIHEATHRRFDAPFTIPVNQAAAGTTMLVPPKMGLHFIKVLACFITLDAAGTIKFVQGAGDGTVVADMSGTMNAGGGSAPGIVLAPADISTPWFFTSPDLALGIVTATGKAQGFITACYSPFDA